MDKEHIPSSFDINTFKGLTDILRVHKEGKRETSFYPCCVMTLTLIHPIHTYITPRNDDSYKQNGPSDEKTRFVSCIIKIKDIK